MIEKKNDATHSIYVTRALSSNFAILHPFSVIRDKFPESKLTMSAFVLAIFISAFLLFAIQPMFAKMILPQLGGSSGVWSVAMVFFQTMLLAGYAYANALTRYLPLRTAMITHNILMAVVFLTLPIGLSQDIGTPPPYHQATWLVKVFTQSIGLPFFALSGNGPLLQAWFAHSGHKRANDPYFLYSASNLGSFAALLLYPTLFEPVFTLSEQSRSWSFGFGFLTLLIGMAGFLVAGGNNNTKTIDSPDSEYSGLPERSSRIDASGNFTLPKERAIVAWTGLAFLPSALLVAVTAYITTDIASAPFLWVLPLTLYLLTFILIFRDKPLTQIGIVARIMPLIAGTMLVMTITRTNIALEIVLHLGFFLAASLLWHKRLYELRPEPARLTVFYFWVSVGGVLGGLFSGLFAPMAFDRIMEYPILVCLAFLLHPKVCNASREALGRELLPVSLISAAMIVVMLAKPAAVVSGASLPIISLYLSLGGMLCLFWRPLVVLPLLALALFDLNIALPRVYQTVFYRSFFGVHRVSLFDDRYRVLSHGTTVHGAERIFNDDGAPVSGRPAPLAYYHPEGALAATLQKLPRRPGGRDLGLIGLGTGAHTCNGEVSDRWRIYEIDAEVVRIARQASLFRFLSECAPAAAIVTGDARLRLGEEFQTATRESRTPVLFDYLLVDAFSSDSIPAHLLTREAVALYLSRLRPDGVMVLHITNRHMSLEGVVAAIASDLKLAIRVNRPRDAPIDYDRAMPLTAVALARSASTLAPYSPEDGWIIPEIGDARVWTDDYSNIAGAIWRQIRAPQRTQ